MERFGQFNMPAIARYRFGLVPGMQCSVIEWARHLAELGMPTVPSLPQWQTSSNQPLARTARCCRFGRDDAPRAVSLSYPNTLAFKLYQEEVVYERHRHRYEFNNAYRLVFLNRLRDYWHFSGWTLGGNYRTAQPFSLLHNSIQSFNLALPPSHLKGSFKP